MRLSATLPQRLLLLHLLLRLRQTWTTTQYDFTVDAYLYLFSAKGVS